MDWVLGRVVDQSHCRTYVDNTKVTDFVFANDAVILAESMEVTQVVCRHTSNRKER